MDIIDETTLVKGYKNCNYITGHKNICDITKKMVVGSIKNSNNYYYYKILIKYGKIY